MEEERHDEQTKAKEQDLVTYHPPLLPRIPFIWFMITDGENESERHIFYSIIEDQYYVRFLPELKNKHVAYSYEGWLVLRDKSTFEWSILNILTMERLQLPPLNFPPSPHMHKLLPDCVMSSSRMDGSCRVIFFPSELRKFWSCHLGDSEFIERESTYIDGCIITKLINFKGKLYALMLDWNLIASDFSDPDLHHEQVISGESLVDLIFTCSKLKIYLVESCEDLLLIFMGSHDSEVCDVKIFKADFSIIGEWAKLETLGDRAIFLGSFNNAFSSCAAAVGMKGNAIYWVIPSSSCRHIYMYDIEDKSISMSFPMTFNNEKMPEQKYSSLFEASPREKATIESTELQIEQRKPQKREVTDIVRKENLWADLPNDLLLEIFPQLFAGETVSFRSVCKSWYSVSRPSNTTQQFVPPLKSSDCSSPLLVCPDNKIYHPIQGKLYSMDFSVIHRAIVRAAWDGWLLMVFNSTNLFFYNPVTKAEFVLPDCNAMVYYSVYFSVPPTSAGCLIVVAAMRWDNTFAICSMKWGEEDWTCYEISQKKESFYFSLCNAVVRKGRYYFLGDRAKLLIFNPKKDDVRVINAPKFINKLIVEGGQQYLLENDGKLIAVFVVMDGSSVYTREWNVRMSKWKILGSLGNNMLFVSRPLSLSITATVSGTGNKIYFPRVDGDGHILFYSLATKRHHTFEMGTSYSNFSASKFYLGYNGCFMP